jgi:hypothetical protein
MAAGSMLWLGSEASVRSSSICFIYAERGIQAELYSLQFSSMAQPILAGEQSIEFPPFQAMTVTAHDCIKMGIAGCCKCNALINVILEQ